MTVPVLAIAALLVVILAGSSMHRKGQLARRSLPHAGGRVLPMSFSCGRSLTATAHRRVARPGLRTDVPAGTRASPQSP